MMPEIVPAVVWVRVPSVIGDPHAPLASESWAVKTLPAVKTPVMVKGTETDDPEQNGEPVMVPVVMVCFLVAITK